MVAVGIIIGVVVAVALSVGLVAALMFLCAQSKPRVAAGVARQGSNPRGPLGPGRTGSMPDDRQVALATPRSMARGLFGSNSGPKGPDIVSLTTARYLEHFNMPTADPMGGAHPRNSIHLLATSHTMPPANDGQQSGGTDQWQGYSSSNVTITHGGGPGSHASALTPHAHQSAGDANPHNFSTGGQAQSLQLSHQEQEFPQQPISTRRSSIGHASNNGESPFSAAAPTGVVIGQDRPSWSKTASPRISETFQHHHPHPSPRMSETYQHHHNQTSPRMSETFQHHHHQTSPRMSENLQHHYHQHGTDLSVPPAAQAPETSHLLTQHHHHHHHPRLHAIQEGSQPPSGQLFPPPPEASTVQLQEPQQQVQEKALSVASESHSHGAGSHPHSPQIYPHSPPLQQQGARGPSSQQAVAVQSTLVHMVGMQEGGGSNAGADSRRDSEAGAPTTSGTILAGLLIAQQAARHSALAAVAHQPDQQEIIMPNGSMHHAPSHGHDHLAAHLLHGRQHPFSYSGAVAGGSGHTPHTVLQPSDELQIHPASPGGRSAQHAAVMPRAGELLQGGSKPGFVGRKSTPGWLLSHGGKEKDDHVGHLSRLRQASHTAMCEPPRMDSRSGQPLSHGGGDLARADSAGLSDGDSHAHMGALPHSHHHSLHGGPPGGSTTPSHRSNLSAVSPAVGPASSQSGAASTAKKRVFRLPLFSKSGSGVPPTQGGNTGGAGSRRGSLSGMGSVVGSPDTLGHGEYNGARSAAGSTGAPGSTDSDLAEADRRLNSGEGMAGGLISARGVAFNLVSRGNNSMTEKRSKDHPVVVQRSTASVIYPPGAGVSPLAPSMQSGTGPMPSAASMSINSRASLQLPHGGGTLVQPRKSSVIFSRDDVQVTGLPMDQLAASRGQRRSTVMPIAGVLANDSNTPAAAPLPSNITGAGVESYTSLKPGSSLLNTSLLNSSLLNAAAGGSPTSMAGGGGNSGNTGAPLYPPGSPVGIAHAYSSTTGGTVTGRPTISGALELGAPLLQMAANQAQHQQQQQSVDAAVSHAQGTAGDALMPGGETLMMLAKSAFTSTGVPASNGSGSGAAPAGDHTSISSQAAAAAGGGHGGGAPSQSGSTHSPGGSGKLKGGPPVSVSQPMTAAARSVSQAPTQVSSVMTSAFATPASSLLPGLSRVGSPPPSALTQGRQSAADPISSSSNLSSATATALGSNNPHARMSLAEPPSSVMSVQMPTAAGSTKAEAEAALLAACRSAAQARKQQQAMHQQYSASGARGGPGNESSRTSLSVQHQVTGFSASGGQHQDISGSLHSVPLIRGSESHITHAASSPVPPPGVHGAPRSMRPSHASGMLRLDSVGLSIAEEDQSQQGSFPAAAAGSGMIMAMSLQGSYDDPGPPHTFNQPPGHTTNGTRLAPRQQYTHLAPTPSLASPVATPSPRFSATSATGASPTAAAEALSNAGASTLAGASGMRAMAQGGLQSTATGVGGYIMSQRGGDRGADLSLFSHAPSAPVKPTPGTPLSIVPPASTMLDDFEEDDVGAHAHEESDEEGVVEFRYDMSMASSAITPRVPPKGFVSKRPPNAPSGSGTTPGAGSGTGGGAGSSTPTDGDAGKRGAGSHLGPRK